MSYPFGGGPVSAGSRPVPPRRAVWAVGGLLLGLLGLSGLGPRGAGAEAVPPADGVYRLTNACSGLALDIGGAGLHDSAPAVVWQFTGAAHQQWRLTGTGAGRSRLTALHSGKLLDVSHGGRQGAPVIQYRATGGANQDWLIRPAGGGQVYLTPAHAPGLRLEVRGAAGAAGTPVQVGQAQGGCAQRWKLQAVAVPARTPRLTVSPDGRSLVQADG